MIEHFGEKLHSPLEITVDAMAEICSLSSEQIRRVLNALNNDILLWENSFSGRAIELVDPDKIEPDIDDNELDQHRNYEQARLDAVEGRQPLRRIIAASFQLPWRNSVALM